MAGLMLNEVSRSRPLGYTIGGDKAEKQWTYLSGFPPQYPPDSSQLEALQKDCVLRSVRGGWKEGDVEPIVRASMDLHS